MVDARMGALIFWDLAFTRRISLQEQSDDHVDATIAQKSERRFRDEVRALTARWTHCLPQQEVMDRVNRYVAGWVNYFHLHNSTRCLPGSDIFWSGECSSTCGGDDRSKGFDRASGQRPGSIKSLEWSRSHSTCPISVNSQCLEVKMIGKPYAGELQVRFDEGEQDCVSRRS